jgi:hypothetical protein
MALAVLKSSAARRTVLFSCCAFYLTAKHTLQDTATRCACLTYIHHTLSIQAGSHNYTVHCHKIIEHITLRIHLVIKAAYFKKNVEGVPCV